MNEWKVPLAILIMSSLIFVAITMAFGVRINRITGETEIEIALQQQEQEYKDPWIYDPMSIVWSSHWRYYCIAGYFVSLGLFSIAWFEFMKWEKENGYRKSGKDET